MSRFIDRWRDAGMPKFPNGEDEEVAMKIKDSIEKLINIPIREVYDTAIKEIVEELKLYHEKILVYGLIKYLNDPARKSEFITEKKLSASPNEMALIDLIQFINITNYGSRKSNNFWDIFLDGLEFTLFIQENDAPPPCLDVIESVAHFYANVCKFRGDLTKLLMLVINAMYYMTYEVIPLVEVCLDVAPGLFPRFDAHVNPDKVPLSRCILFLLDSFNYRNSPARVHESYQRLKIKYRVTFSAQDEKAFLFVMMASIVNLTGHHIDSTYLEIAFIMLTKQRGAMWAHKNILKKMFIPVINGEIDAPATAGRFCIMTSGALLKHYDDGMTVQIDEVVNVLINVFREPTQANLIKEDIVRSLIYMGKRHLKSRINALLRGWTPDSLTPELREAFSVYTRT